MGCGCRFNRSPLVVSSATQATSPCPLPSLPVLLHHHVSPGVPMSSFQPPAHSPPLPTGGTLCAPTPSSASPAPATCWLGQGRVAGGSRRSAPRFWRWTLRCAFPLASAADPPLKPFGFFCAFELKKGSQFCLWVRPPHKQKCRCPRSNRGKPKNIVFSRPQHPALRSDPPLATTVRFCPHCF